MSFTGLNAISGLFGCGIRGLPKHGAIEDVDFSGLSIQRHAILGSLVDDRGVGSLQGEAVGQFGDLYDDAPQQQLGRVNGVNLQFARPLHYDIRAGVKLNLGDAGGQRESSCRETATRGQATGRTPDSVFQLQDSAQFCPDPGRPVPRHRRRIIRLVWPV